jgi:uncharacterized membrane-anchored protein
MGSVHAVRSFWLIMAVLLLASSPGSAQQQEGMAVHDEAWFASFPWQVGPTTIVVDAANAHLALTADEIALSGPAAGRFLAEVEGTESVRQTHALVVKVEGLLAETELHLQHIPMGGYVSDDDWGELDPEDLLATVRRKTAEDNEERVAKGILPIEVLGWTQEPMFDRATGTVFWAIRASQGASHVINASALKLSRDGMTKITWVGRPDQFVNARSALDPALARYSFDPGWRYADIEATDMAAGIGVAALTRQMLTGRAAKSAAAAAGAGVMAIALAFAKKAWFLIFFPIAWAWRRLRKDASSSTDRNEAG